MNKVTKLRILSSTGTDCICNRNKHSNAFE